jgi:hypothetical protein
MLIGLLVACAGFGGEGFLLGVGDPAEIFDALGVMVVGIIVMALAAMMLTPRNITESTENTDQTQTSQPG